MQQYKHDIDVITMGCSKNLVDSEKLLSMFQEHGYMVHHNPEHTHGDIAVINTCGFIASAKEESINEILELCELKNMENSAKPTTIMSRAARFFVSFMFSLLLPSGRGRQLSISKYSVSFFLINEKRELLMGI